MVTGVFVTLTGGCALFDAWNRIAAKAPMPFTVLVGLLLIASVLIAAVLVAQMGAPLVLALAVAGTAPIWLTVVIVALIASFPSSPASPGVLT